MGVAEDIKQKAFELGFDLIGVTGAWPIDAGQVNFLTDWLKHGYAGQMSYMQRNFEKRIEPAKLLDRAQSVICVSLNYKPPTKKKKPPDPTIATGRIASYAQYEDYHPFIKKRLSKLIDFIGGLVTGEFKFKICVDSAPLAERAFAARAGLGFIGKNHLLVSPDLGPQIFLGEIITDLELETDAPIAGDCSGCDRCIKACPTGALRADGQFDANRCISYLTIEHKGEIPADLAERIGDRLFGCDECVLACPYQKEAPVCKNKEFTYYEDRARLSLAEVLNLNAKSFEAKFGDSVIKRSGLERLKRNAEIAIKNIAGGKTNKPN